MNIISRKGDIDPLLDKCLHAYQRNGVEDLIATLHNNILSKKVKFPLLEYCGRELHQQITPEDHDIFCDKVEALKAEGGNVIIGIMLQETLSRNFKHALNKAVEYISRADIWYVCDIIGERVFGQALVHWPKKTIHEIERLSTHQTNWVIRSLGVGIHYAIKKELDADYVKQLFTLLLTMANTKDKEIKQGVGLAVQTTAKFHPEIISDFKVEIADKESVANWFRAKVKIGLKRSAYAQED